MKTIVIKTHINSELKKDVEYILTQMGISTTQAITMFFEQIRLTHGIPFELKIPIPNEETIKAMQDARANRDLESISIEQLKTLINQ